MKTYNWTEKSLQDLAQRLGRLEAPRDGLTAPVRRDGSARPMAWGKTSTYDTDTYPTGTAHNYRVQLQSVTYDRTLDPGLDYNDAGPPVEGYTITAIGDGTKAKHHRLARCWEPCWIPEGTLVPLCLRQGLWYIDLVCITDIAFSVTSGTLTDGLYDATVLEVCSYGVGLPGMVDDPTPGKVKLKETMGLSASMVASAKGWARWVRPWSTSPREDVADEAYWSVYSLICN